MRKGQLSGFRIATPLLLLLATTQVEYVHAQEAETLTEIHPGDPEVTPPELLNGAEVNRLLARNYPPLLRDRKISGEVVIRARVLESGRVDTTTIEVVSASEPDFGEVAARILAHAVFRPARVKGRPVSFILLYPINFSAEP
jgi:TonB family protein